MKKKEDKKKDLEALHRDLEESRNLFVTGYEKLRAADVVARLRGADAAELGAIELYESTHRKRRTVLEGVVREIKRRPPA